MGTQAAAVHQQVLERTKNLIFRTQTISSSIDKKLKTTVQTAEPFGVSLIILYKINTHIQKIWEHATLIFNQLCNRL